MKHRLFCEGFRQPMFLDGVELEPEPSQRLRNHSPDGFCWGYGGSGPCQLALAVLQKLKGDSYALENYQKFKWEVIAKIPQGRGFDIQFEVFMIEGIKPSKTLFPYILILSALITWSILVERRYNKEVVPNMNKDFIMYGGESMGIGNTFIGYSPRAIINE